MKIKHLTTAFCLIGSLCTASGLQARTSLDSIAGFEDLGLAPESYWSGQDTNGLNDFQSGGFLFENNFNAEWQSWNGFAYSNISLSGYDTSLSYDNQYRSCPGGGSGSAAFAIGYTFTGSPAIAKTPDSVLKTLQGVYLANNTYAAHSALNGDAFGATAFDQGDFLKLTIVGKNRQTPTDTLEFFLADYRDEDPAEHYFLSTWEWCDLSPLGPVSSVEFSVSSSQSNQYGDLIPSYFCLDDFHAGPRIDTFLLEASLTEAATNPKEPLANASAGFDQVFQLPGTGHYQVEMLSQSDSASVNFRIDPEGNLLEARFLQANSQGSALFKAVRNGRSAYVRVMASLSSTPNETKEGITLELYPVPVQDRLHLHTNEPSYTLEIFNMNGQRVAYFPACKGSMEIPAGQLRPGLHVLRVHTGTGLSVNRKFMVL